MREENTQKNDDDIVIEFGSENAGAEEKIKKLKEEFKKCLKEKADYLAGWQRAKADFINFKREEEEKKLQFVRFSEQELVKDLLQVLDGFNNAFAEKKWQDIDKNWRDGIKSLYDKIINILKDHNAEEIKVEGLKFNPAEHEAIGEIETKDEREDGMVMEEFRKGYKIHNKIIRPAQVKVGKFKN